MPRLRELNPWEEQRLAEFFAASESFRSITTPYLVLAALRVGDRNMLIAARVVFASPSAIVIERGFDSKSIRVFVTRLADVQSAEAIIRSAVAEYGLPPVGSHTVFEAYHTTPVSIDREISSLSGTNLSTGIRLESGLSTDEVQLSLVATKLGEPAVRKTFSGNQLEWVQHDAIQLGTIRWDVLPGRVVQAIAVFRDTAFHYWWIVDPIQIPNARKAVFEFVDNDLAILREFMVASGSKGSARDLESAVSWLFWMMGFSVAHLGTNTKTQDAVDILAATPNGNFALVECTTGVISTDKKVANLLSRKTLVLERLARASHNMVRVLPVIVTSRGRDEVAQEIRPAEERGVLVLTRDDLVDMLNRTDMLPDADQVFNLAEQQLAQSVDTEPQIPGIG